MQTIFITIPWFTPAFKAGGPIQSIANLVSQFDEGVQYKIFCSNTDLNNEPLVNIETGKWIPYNNITEVWYATSIQRSDTLLEQVKLLKPDILYIIGIYDWYFNLVPLLFTKGVKKILSVRGMLHPGALAEKRMKKNMFIAGWKLMGLPKKITFHATDAAEKKYIEDNFGAGLKISIAGNFPRLFNACLENRKRAGALRMVTIALISPMKNHLLVLQALQHVTARVTYDIFGPVKDSTYWQHCSSLIEMVPKNIRVVYRGDILPSAVEGQLNDTDLFILPSRSENFGHALIEALSSGLPVITSEHTPWNELLPSKAGMNVASTAEALAHSIDFFAGLSPEEFQEYKIGAAAYARERIDVGELRGQYEELFR